MTHKTSTQGATNASLGDMEGGLNEERCRVSD